MAKKTSVNFTKEVVEHLPIPVQGQALYWDRGLKGFGVRVSSTGKRVYVAQGRPNGVSRRVTIGEHGMDAFNVRWTVQNARKRAGELLRDMDSDVDPKETARVAAAKRERDKAELTTLRQVMEEYLDNVRTSNGPLREASKFNIRRYTEIYLKKWLDLPAKDITAKMCEERFRELSKKTPKQADAAMSNLRALLNRAREVHADADGNYTILAVNPVSRMLKTVRLHPDVPATGRIPLNKVGAAWSAVYARRAEPDARLSADYVLFLMLTGLRRTEAAKLKWSRVDFTANTWTIPAEDAKGHRAITLPFCDLLREVIEARPRVKGNDYVFVSRGASGHVVDPRGIMQEVDRAAGVHVSFHDLRRTYEDIARHCGVDSDTRRRLLNHEGLGDVHSIHYANSPDPQVFKEAIDKIGAWVREQVAIAAAGNVINLRSA